MVFVLMAELLNTGLENTIDKTIPQQSKRAGMAKDQGSAAVFVGLVYTAICWVLITYKNFLTYYFE
jgi:diacylglycerol kinase (ATP)